MPAMAAQQQCTLSKKKRKREKASMHPENKYAEKPPDFAFLASRYPSLKPFVSFTVHGKARIDWTDFNATRELTRVLLLHDFGIQWWIPDGQLCPTVPNRANYIHWIHDLLTSHPSPWKDEADDLTWGFDIGTGANCIYPLLGAAIHGWHFIGTDVTDTALKWSRWNIQQNPHLAGMISVRNSRDTYHYDRIDGTCNVLSDCFGQANELPNLGIATFEATDPNNLPLSNDRNPELEVEKDVDLALQQNLHTRTNEDCNVACYKHNDTTETYSGHENLPVLAGVVHDTEKFDFCMCNPPFFESMKEAGLNPHTSCGGTSAEMVYPGGEEGFIMKIVDDSTQLKEQIHWFTTMVGRKVNVKILSSELRKRGVRVVRTTEFVQGRTCRWGLAWSYNAPEVGLPSQRMIPTSSNSSSFIIEELPRHCNAFDVLQSMGIHLQGIGVLCKIDTAAFLLKGSFVDEKEEKQVTVPQYDVVVPPNVVNDPPNVANDPPHFTISVFEQAPGTLLMKGKLLGQNQYSGRFFAALNFVERKLKQSFVKNE